MTFAKAPCVCVTVFVPATKLLLTASDTCVQKRPDGGLPLTLKQIDDARTFTMNAPRTASSFIKRRCPSWPSSLQSLCLDALSYSIVILAVSASSTNS